MTFRLIGIGFETFDIDKHLIGVTTQASDYPRGQYIVKQIRDVSIQHGAVSIFVELLDSDDHTSKKIDAGAQPTFSALEEPAILKEFDIPF